MQYEEGLSLAAEGEYLEAQETFKDLAEVYPSSNFATLSLKELFRLKSYFEDPGYENLTAYYDSISANPADSLLGQTVDWLSIHCDVSAGNYQAAVNRLDSVLQNPGSFTDSIFALIDLGHVMTMMESDSLKSILISKHKSIMPETYKEFKIKRKDWIDELLRSSKVRKPQETTPISAESEDKPGHITSNYPNPANELLTINYIIKVPGKVRFTISSVAGQNLFSYQKNLYSSGEYTVLLDIFDFQKGIYILAFYLNETLLETRKIVR